MSVLAESMVLVEGYDDRDFWKGLLIRSGCTEARHAPPARHRQISGFTYLTASRTLVHVLPCKGSDFAAVVGQKLRDRVDKPLRRLVVSPDADVHATLDDAVGSVRSIVSGACPGATETAEGDLLVDGGALVVSTLLVHAGTARDADGRLPGGVPQQAALEQLACAALCKVHPERGAAVAAWLAGRPAPLGKEHKAHAWSFYAGWTTDHGTGDFYGSLWRDAAVGPELERILRSQGAWRVIEALLKP